MSSYSIFFSKNISVYAMFNDQSFNDALTNDIISTVLVSTISDLQVFLLKNVQMQKLLTFFSKNISQNAIYNEQSFNDMLTKDVSFKQLGPDLKFFNSLSKKALYYIYPDIPHSVQCLTTLALNPPMLNKLTLVLLNLDILCLCKQCRPRLVGF